MTTKVQAANSVAPANGVAPATDVGPANGVAPADGAQESRGSDAGQSARVAIGVVVPAALLALVYALWWISNEASYIGPFDRAAFGWSVVIPLWIATPFVSGRLWARLTPRATATAAILLGLTVSAVAAFLFWRAVAQPACETGTIRQPAEWIGPSLLVGIVVGAGLAISGLVAVSFVRRGQPWRALVAGAAAEFAMVFAGIGTAAFVAIGPACQPPH